MKLLVIDTSTERSIVGLVNQGTVLAERALPFGLRSSSYLDQNIEACFQEAGLVLAEIEGIGVATGPGSFTGIRIGAAFAKGLALARQLPLFGYSTLRGFISPYEGNFASIIEANRQGVYLLLQERRKGEITIQGQEQFINFTDLKDKIASCRYLITPSLSRLVDSYPHDGWLEKAPSMEHIAMLLTKEKAHTSLQLRYMLPELMSKIA